MRTFPAIKVSPMEMVTSCAVISWNSQTVRYYIKNQSYCRQFVRAQSMLGTGE